MVESSSQYTNFPNHGATFLLHFFVTWQSTDINPIMENLNFSGNFASSGSRVNVNIGVFEFKEDDNTIVYSPAFDLSGYGKDLVEAKSSFEIAMEEFFKYTINKNTLVDELKRLGWNIHSMKQRKISAPQLADQIVNNQYLADILNDKQFTKFEQTVGIPC